jgi:hypothetical protein
MNFAAIEALAFMRSIITRDLVLGEVGEAKSARLSAEAAAP